MGNGGARRKDDWREERVVLEVAMVVETRGVGGWRRARPQAKSG